MKLRKLKARMDAKLQPGCIRYFVKDCSTAVVWIRSKAEFELRYGKL